MQTVQKRERVMKDRRKSTFLDTKIFYKTDVYRLNTVFTCPILKTIYKTGQNWFAYNGKVSTVTVKTVDSLLDVLAKRTVNGLWNYRKMFTVRG